jgi:hypothetical protein
MRASLAIASPSDAIKPERLFMFLDWRQLARIHPIPADRLVAQGLPVSGGGDENQQYGNAGE